MIGDAGEQARYTLTAFDHRSATPSRYFTQESAALARLIGERTA